MNFNRIAHPIFSLLWIIVASIFILESVALAEETCPEPSESQSIRELAAEEFRRGEELYDQGDCRAIHKFRCSFRRVPHPSTLYNIGRSAELCEMNDLATRTYRQFLDVFPDNQGTSEVENRLSSLETRLASLETQMEQSHSEEEPDESDDQSTSLSSPEPIVEENAPRQSERNGLAIGAWTSFGLGIALMIPGAALIGVAGSKAGEFSTLRGNPDTTNDELNELASQGQSLVSGGVALLALGSAALVTWVVLFALSRVRRSRLTSSNAQASLVPEPWMSSLAYSIQNEF